MVSKPTIIGTGLSGMIGSRLTELLSESNFTNLDLATGTDITDPVQVTKALDCPPTTVLHLAAFTDVSKAYEEKDNKDGLVYKVNVLGTKNIAEACAQYNHYLIHISTDFVFDGKTPPTSGYTEIDKPHPLEWYGQTKLWAEEAVINSGCQSVIARLAFPFRAKFEPKADLVRKILEQLKNGQLHPMFTDQIITPTFIDDICQVLPVFIKEKPEGIYHVVGSTSLTPYDLALKIATVFNLQTEIKPGSFKDCLKTDPRPRQQYLRLSNAKLKADFGIEMKTIDEALLTLKDQVAVV
ncbi:MAG: NAD(P)-dependent oxidoreductase [Candidatus Beckwithbacteria bacterium]|nr:NAD(P)-dependent oxidoreductase [Candidatus Beckwithbacteria bacterium]